MNNRKARILIVDDQVSARDTMEALLFREGYELVFAHNGNEALEKARGNLPDLVLLDVMMPDMDGFEICRLLRADPALGELPIILVTSLDDSESRLMGIESGADDFIAKPFDSTELRARIRTITRLDRYRKLLAERANYEQLVELSPDGIMVIDEHGIIRLVNSKMLQMLGAVNKDDVIERRISALIEFEDSDPLLSVIERVIDGVEPNPLFEMRINPRGGDHIPVEISCGLFTFMGQPSAQLILRDITDRKRAEEIEREAQTLKRVDLFRKELLSDVSHELRTPLAGIKGYSTLLLSYSDALDKEKSREALESIDHYANKLTRLVDNLLDISRFEAGMVTLEKEQADILDVLQSAVEEAKVLFSQHTISMADTDSVSVYIDIKRISQVIDNLIGNAVKYSAAGTKITLRGQRRETDLIISVSDEGMGIPEDKLDKVFERLYRIDQTQTGAEGIGLGLAICQKIVEAHGGQIWAESTVGKGSTFYFTIPLESPDRED